MGIVGRMVYLYMSSWKQEDGFCWENGGLVHVKLEAGRWVLLGEWCTCVCQVGSRKMGIVGRMVYLYMSSWKQEDGYCWENGVLVYVKLEAGRWVLLGEWWTCTCQVGSRKMGIVGRMVDLYMSSWKQEDGYCWENGVLVHVKLEAGRWVLLGEWWTCTCQVGSRKMGIVGRMVYLYMSSWKQEDGYCWENGGLVHVKLEAGRWVLLGEWCTCVCQVGSRKMGIVGRMVDLYMSSWKQEDGYCWENGVLVHVKLEAGRWVLLGEWCTCTCQVGSRKMGIVGRMVYLYMSSWKQEDGYCWENGVLVHVKLEAGRWVLLGEWWTCTCQVGSRKMGIVGRMVYLYMSSWKQEDGYCWENGVLVGSRKMGIVGRMVYLYMSSWKQEDGYCWENGVLVYVKLEAGRWVLLGEWCTCVCQVGSRKMGIVGRMVYLCMSLCQVGSRKMGIVGRMVYLYMSSWKQEDGYCWENGGLVYVKLEAGRWVLLGEWCTCTCQVGSRKMGIVGRMVCTCQVGSAGRWVLLGEWCTCTCMCTKLEAGRWVLLGEWCTCVCQVGSRKMGIVGRMVVYLYMSSWKQEDGYCWENGVLVHVKLEAGRWVLLGEWCTCTCQVGSRKMGIVGRMVYLYMSSWKQEDGCCWENGGLIHVKLEAGRWVLLGEWCTCTCQVGSRKMGIVGRMVDLHMSSWKQEDGYCWENGVLVHVKLEAGRWVLLGEWCTCTCQVGSRKMGIVGRMVYLCMSSWKQEDGYCWENGVLVYVKLEAGRWVLLGEWCTCVCQVGSRKMGIVGRMVYLYMSSWKQEDGYCWENGVLVHVKLEAGRWVLLGEWWTCTCQVGSRKMGIVGRMVDLYMSSWKQEDEYCWENGVLVHVKLEAGRWVLLGEWWTCTCQVGSRKMGIVGRMVYLYMSSWKQEDDCWENGGLVHVKLEAGYCWENGVLVHVKLEAGRWVLLGEWWTCTCQVGSRKMGIVGRMVYLCMSSWKQEDGYCWENGVLVHVKLEAGRWVLLGEWCTCTCQVGSRKMGIVGRVILPTIPIFLLPT